MQEGITRAGLLRGALALGAAALAGAHSKPAAAQGAGPAGAAAFIQQAANQLFGAVGGANSVEEKRRRLVPFLDQVCDVDGIGRFVLGRYWQQASPQQQQEYLRQFRFVLANGVATRMGDHRQGSIQVQVGRPEQRSDGVYVPTRVDRPGNQPVNVVWVVEPAGGGYRIVDLVAEGVSMRITQRNDYSSFLSRNGGNMGALIQAMQRQVG